MSARVRAIPMFIVAAIVALGTAAIYAESDLVFRGFKHRALGVAALRLDSARGALAVSGLGAAGGDGVAVAAADATSWTARVVTPTTTGVPLRMLWSALVDGRRIGSGLLQQSGSRLEMSGVFTGATKEPTFSAQVYNSGRLVGAIGSLPPTAHATIPLDLCRKVPEFCEFTIEFHTLPDGACMVKFVAPMTGPFVLPNGATATGNELRLVEEVRPAGHYPYLGFDTMTLQSDALSFELLSETLR